MSNVIVITNMIRPYMCVRGRAWVVNHYISPGKRIGHAWSNVFLNIQSMSLQQPRLAVCSSGERLSRWSLIFVAVVLLCTDGRVAPLWSVEWKKLWTGASMLPVKMQKAVMRSPRRCRRSSEKKFSRARRSSYDRWCSPCTMRVARRCSLSVWWMSCLR